MQSYLPLITGSGGALVVLAIVAFLLGTGKLHSDTEFQARVDENRELKDENRDLKNALEIERSTNNELARSGGVAAKALDALVEVATGRHDHDQADRRHEGSQRGRDLTAGDLGL